jgi:murein DD-endopeptidase MepM/ murein hydrolase activator NlpD
VLTPIQHYTPESNLYSYANNKTRLSQLYYHPIQLPFWGEWMINQGHNGKYTHKGEWSSAYDFILLDEEMKSYSSDGLRCEDYYCYNKPVLAPADGFVEEIIDQVEDNEIGTMDTRNNWGNTITIRHLPGLYTQLSHLRKGTFKVGKGDQVKCGDVLANCGNSGRSSHPHLHFQVQTSPKPGSKTIDYPFSYYLKAQVNSLSIASFDNPAEGDTVSGVRTLTLLKKSFDIPPNSVLEFRFKDDNGAEQLEHWEAFTDSFNNNYLYCSQSKSTAYYVNDGIMFYFTTFYGSKKSLLYYFYLTAFKLLLGFYPELTITDTLPLNNLQNKNGLIWLHDFIAPFTNRVKANYSVRQMHADDAYHPQSLTLVTQIDLSIFGKTDRESNGTILLKDNRIQQFTFSNKKIKIEATCTNI